MPILNYLECYSKKCKQTWRGLALSQIFVSSSHLATVCCNWNIHKTEKKIIYIASQLAGYKWSNFLEKSNKKWLESYKLADLNISQLRGLLLRWLHHTQVFYFGRRSHHMDKCGLVLNIILNHFNPRKSNFRKLFQSSSFN